MADQPDTSGFFSSLMSGVGSLLGLGAGPNAQADSNAQRQDETTADYATRRQAARFDVMKQEVDGLLQKYPATKEFPDVDAYRKELQGIRQRGFDQQEEDAIMNTFTHTFGERQGELRGVEAGGSQEWQKQPTPAPGGGVPGGTSDLENRANPPTPALKSPQGPLQQRDDQVYQKLIENWTKSGRSPTYEPGTGKRDRAIWFRSSGPGVET